MNLRFHTYKKVQNVEVFFLNCLYKKLINSHMAIVGTSVTYMYQVWGCSEIYSGIVKVVMAECKWFLFRATKYRATKYRFLFHGSFSGLQHRKDIHFTSSCVWSHSFVLDDFSLLFYFWSGNQLITYSHTKHIQSEDFMTTKIM